MKAALEEWRHWLEGAKVPFIVLTDHRNLEYIRSAKRLNPRQARWSLFFSRFDFKVTYRPGSKNGKADALSRQFDHLPASSSVEPILPPTVILAPIQWDIMTEISEAQTNSPAPLECPSDRTYVPVSLRPRVIKWIHESPSAGHPGINATMELVANRFWWSTLHSDITQFVQKCDTCNISKSSHQRPAGLLHPLPIPQRPWSHIAIDFVTDLPNSNHFTTILTIIDRFSKACRLIPLPKLPTAFETAEALLQNVFRFYGLPEDIVSGPGSAVYVQSMEGFLSTAEHQCQSHLRLSPRIQRPGRTFESRTHPIPPHLLSQQPDRLESLSSVGGVCPKLPQKTRHRTHPFPMRSWIPTTPVSLVWRTFGPPCCRWVAKKE